MKIEVISTWNDKLFKEYAHRFQKTYNWPFDLEIFDDEDLYDIPSFKKFVDRKKVDIPLDYRKDAVRFSYKVYAYTQSILTTKGYDGIIFIDADSVFYKKIDAKWIEKNIYKEGHMISYLGRPTEYSECGFIFFNMKHPFIKQFAYDMRKMYDEELLFKEEQQHDSWIFDVVRKNLEEKYGVLNHSIGDGRVGHVQARSILGRLYDHTKGARKKTGKSKESSL